MNSNEQNQRQVIQQKIIDVQSSKQNQIQRALQMIQSQIQINNTQIKEILLILTKNIMKLQSNEKDDKNNYLHFNQINLKQNKKCQNQWLNKTDEHSGQMFEGLQKQKGQLLQRDQSPQIQKQNIQGELSLIKKQINSELQIFSQKFEHKLQILNQKIQEESYQTEKRLYQKWSYIIREMQKDINLTKNQKQQTKQIKFLSQSNHDNKSLEFNDIIVQERNHQEDDGQEESKMVSQKGRMSLQFKQNQYTKKRRNYRYSSSDIASLSDHHLGSKFKTKEETLKKNAEIVIQSEAQKRQLIIISDNIKVQGFKKSCRIKIRKIKSWIAIGVIDYNMRFKPAKSIGERWVYYCNDGQIWSGKKSFFNEGCKFKFGQVVQISYDQLSKAIEWRVKDKLKYSLKCMKLNYNQNWVPFIYFFSKGDEVLLLPAQK